MAKEMKRILIISRIYTSNLGDQLIGSTMYKLFQNYGEVIQTDLSTYHVGIDIHSNILSKRKRKNIFKGALLYILNKLRFNSLYWYVKNGKVLESAKKQEYDLIIIGGGELISPSFAIPLNAWANVIKKYQKNAKVGVFGVGVTLCNDLISRKRIKNFLDLCQFFYVRDNNSLYNLSYQYGKNGIEIPDVVYFNDFNNNTNKIINLYGITSIDRILRHNKIFKSEKNYFQASYTEIKSILKYGEVLIFYTSREDYNVCVRFLKYCKNEYGEIFKIATIQTLNDLVKLSMCAKSVYSPRMHACIIGQLCGAVVHPIPISQKMNSFNDKYLRNFDLLKAKDCLYKNVLTIIE